MSNSIPNSCFLIENRIYFASKSNDLFCDLGFARTAISEAAPRMFIEVFHENEFDKKVIKNKKIRI